MRERLTIFVIVGMRTDEHSLRSQVGIGSESEHRSTDQCLYRHRNALDRCGNGSGETTVVVEG